MGYAAAIFVCIVAAVALGLMMAPAGAPNSGGGDTDGSGFEEAGWQFGETLGATPGPAPNAGDGIPDGSGW